MGKVRSTRMGVTSFHRDGHPSRRRLSNNLIVAKGSGGVNAIAATPAEDPASPVATARRI
jgi:hypothetical protein